MEDNSGYSNGKDNDTEHNGNITDLAFKFPLKESFSKVEIPFSFQNNLNDNSKSANFHSYIKIQDTPTLYLDISSEENVDKLFLASTIESLRSENSQQEQKIKAMEKTIRDKRIENESIKEELIRHKEDFIGRNQCIQAMGIKIKKNEEKYERYLLEVNSRLNEKNIILNNLKEKYDSLERLKKEKNISDSSNELLINTAKEKFSTFMKEYCSSKEYLKAKFSYEPLGDKYIQKSLQLDLLDYQAYVKEQLKTIKPKISELIYVIQKAVNNAIGSEYEVKLYGSHATNLCLPWSDLDVVIIKNDDSSITNCHTLLAELYRYLKDNQIFNIMNFISTTTIPLIKIQTEENFNGISVDISLQSNIHYGIKCVALVMNFIKEYEVLVPMVLAIKNILKKADLNNPYKVKYYF
ncbi:MAG: nucleotidyltransferase domain-containing protein [archaeon]|nr:nucleotidyltransferase domain-containing protein [archaeon]